jgi:membrane protease YdiL (CAAX protease family)
VLPPPDWVTEAFEPLYDPQNMWGALLTLVIAAPLTEEPIFRGLILRGFLARYPTRKAVLVSALLFGAVHLNPWQFVGGTAFGVLAGWWLVRTGSLVPGLFGHALNNGLPSLAQAFGLEIRGYTGALSGPVQFQPLWFDAVGAVLLGTGLWLTRRALPDTFPPPRINPTNSTAPSSS